MTQDATALAGRIEQKLKRSLETGVQPRSMITGDELSLVAAALRAVQADAVAWRWHSIMNPDHWSYATEKPVDHPQYITEPLYTHPHPQPQQSTAMDNSKEVK